MKKSLLLLLVLAFCLGSCQTKDAQDREQNQVEQAVSLMERGEYSEAIVILRELFDQLPSDENAQRLASAYAGRAGLKVENYWGFVVGYKSFLEPSEEDKRPLVDLKELSAQIPADVREKINSLNLEVSELRVLKRRIEQIPYFEYSKRGDLQEGTRVLAKVSSSGGRLYRAVLELVLLRSAIEDTATKVADWAKPDYQHCGPHFTTSLQWIAYSFDLIVETAQDLMRAFPKDNQKYEPALKEIDKAKALRADLQSLIEETKKCVQL